MRVFLQHLFMFFLKDSLFIQKYMDLILQNVIFSSIYTIRIDSIHLPVKFMLPNTLCAFARVRIIYFPAC